VLCTATDEDIKISRKRLGDTLALVGSEHKETMALLIPEVRI
jgi:hypothetical protein